MIQARDLCLSYGTQKIFDHISFIIGQDDTVGLVGRNGSGKSTLLKAIAHQSILDAGSISIIKNKKLAYMPQDVVLESTASIIDETMTAFEELEQIKKALALIEDTLANVSHDVLEQYAQLQERLALINEPALRAQAKKLLNGLGFAEEQHNNPVSSLSVGWKMRIVLAKLLLQDADFYLFDEPTNHLDLLAKEWFLNFLKTARFGFLLVCHERYFLNELCSSILELERGKGIWYTGNYDAYVVQKEHNAQLLESAYLQQQKEIKQKQATIERFRAKASKAGMAQSMLKSLEKIERITLPPGPKDISFHFKIRQQPGRTVLTLADVAQQFGDKKIFEHVSCAVERGQKVAIIAPNGGGKTTLFNLIIGALPLQKGTVTFGYNVDYALFNQDQNKALDKNKTVLENVIEQCPQETEQAIRSMLGAFLFGKEEVQKKVGVLSGGEKNRVGMVCVLLQQANLLLLDEPTNHLDIQSKEILLKALQEYQGTLLFVSHDRDFVNSLATHILSLTPTGAYLYEGNYDAFVQQTTMVAKQAQPAEVKTASTIVPRTAHMTSDDRKKIARLESKIEKLEATIKTLELSFAELSYGTPPFIKAEQDLSKARHELAQAMQEWEGLQ